MAKRCASMWSAVLLAAISAARIGMGIYVSIAGPTLLYLADNVSSSVGMVSTVLGTTSAGALIGAILGGVLSKNVGPQFRHLWTIALAIGLQGLLELSIPWVKELWLLIIIGTTGGIMYGYLDAGMQALLLKLWGEQGSRSHVQLFHFMFCVGAFLTPIVARPFLVMALENEPAESGCPNEIHASVTSDIFSATTIVSYSTTSNTTQTYDFNPIGWVYVIASMWLLLISMFMFILASLKVEDKVGIVIKTSDNNKEERLEENIRDVIWVFIPLIAYYFCSVATENVFYNYLYSVAVCSGLKLSVSEASVLNSVMWIALSLARFIGIFASRYLEPRTIIITSISGSIMDSLIMCIFGEYTAWIAWTVASSHGLTTSLLFPTGVSWLSQITNVSGTYMFIFTVGGCLSSFTMLPLAGYLFDRNPFTVIYLTFIAAAFNAVCYGVCIYTGNRHLKLIARNHKRSESSTIENHELMDVQQATGKA